MASTELKTRFEAGPVTFVVRHELWDGNIQDHADQGVAIMVAAEVDGKQTNLLRFNCFDIEKSYIYGPENRDLKSDGPMMLQDMEYAPTGIGKLYRMDPIADGNPISWTIKTLAKKLPDMLIRAGYSEIAEKLDLEGSRDAFQQALRLSPEDHDASFNLAVIHGQLGQGLEAVDPEAARRHYRSALELEPGLTDIQDRLQGLNELP